MTRDTDTDSDRSYIMVSSHPSSLTSSRLTVSPLVLANLNSEPVSELLYSGFLEHVGRCIYGGIVDSPKHPSPAKLLETTDHGDEVSKGRLGWRKDVVDLIGKKGDLEVPMLRWPGGELLPRRTVSMLTRRGTLSPTTIGKMESDRWMSGRGALSWLGCQMSRTSEY